MKPEDYPTIYSKCSACSESNQKKHFQLLKMRIVLLIGYAVLGAVAWSKITDLSVVPLVAITIALSLLLIFTLVMEMRKFDRLWFTSRAVAEVVKMETWLFMMRATPYDQVLPEEEADMNFVESIRKVANSQPSVIPELAQYRKEGTQITGQMREIVVFPILLDEWLKCLHLSL
ncbi:DUF4231 domain-containing protein [Candidatus Bathyarchaeota archaeon]|nr:DUF4231 domain-containing protein [Candidatus Bathyarchaeota archaeon]